MQKLARILILIVFVVAMVGGASAQDDARILRIGFTEEPEMLINYFSIAGLVDWLHRLHTIPQWGMTASGEMVPFLIDEMPSIENGGVSENDEGNTVIQFTIADWAVWSDGTPITAADFVLPSEIRYDGISALTPAFFLDGSEAVVEQGETEKDVVITFPSPNPDWHLADVIPLPNHILRETYEAGLEEGQGFEVTHAEFLRAPTVGNGPFIFEEWVTGSYIRFVRNDNYWKDVWMDEVQLQFFQDATVIEQLAVAGEIEQTNYILPASRSVELAEQYDYLEVRPYFDSLKLEIRLNQGPDGHPALKDVRVRKAILMGIDRQFMVDEIYDGLSQIANSFWGTTVWDNEDIPVPDYDPEAAIALLREAGWYDDDGDGVAESHGVEGVEDGTPLEMTATTYSEIQHYQDSLLYIQDALSDIGLSADITLYTIPVMHSDWNANSPFITGIHDLYLLGWWGASESIGVYGPYTCDQIPSADNPSGQNAVHICNERLDELWSSLFVTMDPEERQAIADEIQFIMADEALTLYLLETAQTTLYNTRLEWESHLAVDMSPWLTIETWQFTE